MQTFLLSQAVVIELNFKRSLHFRGGATIKQVGKHIVGLEFNRIDLWFTKQKITNLQKILIPGTIISLGELSHLPI